MKKMIEKLIDEKVSASSEPIFRQPLTGYADAGDPIFRTLKSVIGPEHLLPAEILPGAKSVVAFFIPFSKEIIVGNREGEYASRKWAEAYDITNKLIDSICLDLSKTLSPLGVQMAWLLPTYEFDREKLIAQWSHRHAAYACGLGSFGRNNMIITKQGCAGRFGTAILDTYLEPSPRAELIHACSRDNGCVYCVQICPVHALGEADFDRHKCYQRLLENDRLYPDLDLTDVCGKCVTGPCACTR